MCVCVGGAVGGDDTKLCKLCGLVPRLSTESQSEPGIKPRCAWRHSGGGKGNNRRSLPVQYCMGYFPVVLFWFVFSATRVNNNKNKNDFCFYFVLVMNVEIETDR